MNKTKTTIGQLLILLIVVFLAASIVVYFKILHLGGGVNIALGAVLISEFIVIILLAWHVVSYLKQRESGVL